METLLDTYYTVTGAQLRIYYRASSSKPYILKVMVDDDERDLFYYANKELAEVFAWSIVRAFIDCLLK